MYLHTYMFATNVIYMYRVHDSSQPSAIFQLEKVFGHLSEYIITSNQQSTYLLTHICIFHSTLVYYICKCDV